jgi:hypothetical protein
MKKRLRRLLVDRNFDQIAELACQQRRVLGLLIALTFDRDPEVGWRAVEAMSWAAERIAPDDSPCVRDHLRRLHWLLSEESGGICWRAPEAMAEIIRRCPDHFRDYAPIVVYLIREMAEEDLIHFRAGILWAIGRLAPVSHQEFNAVLPTILACLDRTDPQVRGTAAWCLGQYDRGELLAGRDDLLADDALVSLYEEASLVQVTVAELTRRSLEQTHH